MTRSERRKKQYKAYCKNEMSRQKREVTISSLYSFCENCPNCEKRLFADMDGATRDKWDCKKKARESIYITTYKDNNDNNSWGCGYSNTINGYGYLTLSGKCPDFVMVCLEDERTPF